MNGYERSPLLPGIAGVAAALATIATLAVAILVPAKLSSTQAMVVTAPAATAAPVEVAGRYRIEVIGSRKANSV